MSHLTMLTGNVVSLIFFISCSCTTVSNAFVKLRATMMDLLEVSFH